MKQDDYRKIEMEENAHLRDIKKAYEAIDHQWLNWHFKTTMQLVVFATCVELVLGYSIIGTELLTTTVEVYCFKYMAFPAVLNCMLLGIGYYVMHSKRYDQRSKIRLISLLYVAICSVLTIVHSLFVPIYYIFAVGIMLTTVYSDYKVSLMTSAAALCSMVGSELLIQWDPSKASVFHSTMRATEFLIALFTLLALTAVSFIVIRFEKKKNDASMQVELERLLLQKRLHQDELTGIYNRRALHEALKDMEEDIQEVVYALAIVDIDNFKSINDTYGHQAGDHVLQSCANVMRQMDLDANVYRYGGDEFCILFRHHTMTEVYASCQKLTHEMKEISLAEYPLLQITVSIGIAISREESDAVRLFHYADQALYEAKQKKDRICVRL